MNRNATPGKAESRSSVWVVALLAIVLVSIMLLSVTGGILFRHITDNRKSNMDTRAALSYVSARVLSADEADGIKADGPVLRIGKSCIFLKDGYLYEGKSEDAPDAGKIAQTSVFDASLSGNMLTVRTDQGTREIYLHAEEAGSPDQGTAEEAGS